MVSFVVRNVLLLSAVLSSAVVFAGAQAVCPPSDNDGSSLSNSGTDGSFITCTYEGAGLCEYFQNGSFSSGSSSCPNPISQGTNASPQNSDSSSQVNNGNSNTNSTATCPPQDNDNSPLTQNGTDGEFVTCTYESAGLCEYFQTGSFSSGSSTCPSSISQGSNTKTSSPPDSGNSSQTSDGNSSTNSTATVTCPPLDNNNSPLTSNGTDGEFVTCTYERAGLCEYFQNGSFSSGSSTCPSNISAPGDGLRNSTDTNSTATSTATGNSTQATPTTTATPTSTTTATATATPSGFITSFSLGPVPTLNSSNKKSSAVSLFSVPRGSVLVMIGIALGFTTCL